MSSNPQMWSDIVVVHTITGHLCYAHKEFLTAGSPVFAAMFRTPMVESACNKVTVAESGAVFRALLGHLYSPQVPLPPNTLAQLADQLLVAAEKYKIDALKRQCEQYLCGQVDVSNVVNMLCLSHNTHSASLKQACIEFVGGHRSAVVESDQWTDLVIGGRHNSLVTQVINAVGGGDAATNDAERMPLLSTGGRTRSGRDRCCRKAIKVAIFLVTIVLCCSPLELIAWDFLYHVVVFKVVVLVLGGVLILLL